MSRHINKFETFLTFLFIILSAIGITYSLINRVDLSPGELTFDNYSEYISIDFSYGVDYVNPNGAAAFISYDVSVLTSDYEIENLKISFIISTPKETLESKSVHREKISRNIFVRLYSSGTNISISGVDLFSDILTIQIVSISGTYRVPRKA